MSTKELIAAEIESLNEEQLRDFYILVRNFTETKKQAPEGSLMSNLKRVKINAPADFSANFDLYTSGKKSV